MSYLENGVNRLRVWREEAARILWGSSFHSLGPIIQKALPPTVESFGHNKPDIIARSESPCRIIWFHSTRY